MIEKRGKKRFLKILIIIIAIALVFVGVRFFSSKTPVQAMVLDAIEIRQAKEPLKKATLISELDSLVQQAGNARVTEQWDALVDCLAKGCPDDLYFEFILAVALEYQKELPHSALVINLISTNRYWGSESVIEFSRAMTLVDSEIQAFRSRTIEKKWGEIIECNGTCAEKNTLFFELIKLVVSA